MSVAGIILAAGGSSRLGEPKQLLRDASGEQLVHKAARELLAVGVRPVFVVVGAVADEVAMAVADLKVMVIRNNDWQSGIAGSISPGVMALSLMGGGADAVVLATCDMPSVDEAHLQAILDAYANSATRVASAYANSLGVPALFREEEFDDLIELTGDKGAKHLFAREGTVAIPLGNAALDIDTPEDVALWRAREKP